MKKNHVIFYAKGVMTTCINILIIGSVIQTFLMESGCTEGQVSAYVSVMQVIQVATMLLLSGKMEKIKNVFRYIAGSYVMQIPLLLTMLLLSIKYQTWNKHKDFPSSSLVRLTPLVGFCGVNSTNDITELLEHNADELSTKVAEINGLSDW